MGATCSSCFTRRHCVAIERTDAATSDDKFQLLPPPPPYPEATAAAVTQPASTPAPAALRADPETTAYDRRGDLPRRSIYLQISNEDMTSFTTPTPQAYKQGDIVHIINARSSHNYAAVVFLVANNTVWVTVVSKGTAVYNNPHIYRNIVYTVVVG